MDSFDRIRTRALERGRGRYLGARLGKSLCFVQDDQTVANAPGATVRADINANLQALVTNSQGASAPGTTWRNQIWHDTTANVIKRRNAANSGWIVVGSLDETFAIARSSNTILGLNDYGKLVNATSSFTQTLTAAATLGDGWWIRYRNDGAGAIVLDPNASETINGATTLTLNPGEAVVLVCNGSTFTTVDRVGFATTSTDNAVVRFDSTTGKTQDSGVTIDDSNNVIIPGTAVLGGTAASQDDSAYMDGSGVLNLLRASSAGTTHAAIINGGANVGGITSNTTTTFFNTTSDERLKENIANLTGALELLAKIRPRTFSFKRDPQKSILHGFIAQELDKVYPAAVPKPEDPEAMLTVDASKLMPLVVAALQELAARVAALE